MRLIRSLDDGWDVGFLPVLIGAIVVFALTATAGDTDGGSAVLSVVVYTTLLSALKASGVHGRWFQVAVLAGAIAAVAGVVAAATSDGVLLGPRALVAFTLWLVAPVVVLLRVLRDRRVTMNTIYGAITAYVLFAIIMGQLYAAIEVVESGSFTIPGEEKEYYTADLLYFSVVTQTTLGFGDISPAKAVPRALAAMQAILGQVFLVVLVARLVALEIAQNHQNAED